jgi:hypothetical protein
MKSKKIVTLILTTGLLAALFAVVLVRNYGTDPSALWNRIQAGVEGGGATPEDAVYNMLDAARCGNTRAYLNDFTNPIRRQIDSTLRETTKDKFSSYLAQQNSAFESVALSTTDQPNDHEAQIKVEYVFNNRNEVQYMHLVKLGRVWKIADVNGSEQIKTLIPFGTEVTD